MIVTSAKLMEIHQALAGITSPDELNSMEVIIKLPQSVFQKVNEDYYYRTNPNDKNGEPPEADELHINVGDLKFIYQVEE